MTLIRSQDLDAAYHATATVIAMKQYEMAQDLYECLCDAGFFLLASALMTWATKQHLSPNAN